MADETSEGSDYQSPIVKAIARLSDALDALEETAREHSTPKAPGEEMQRMSEDRTRLAHELDAEKAHVKRLAEVNSEVSRRLVGVMETVRHVLDDDSSGKLADERPQTNSD